MHKETHIELINVIVDDSNPDYPNAVILAYWKLVSICPGEMCIVRTPYATNLTPPYDGNFAPFESVDDQMIATWIQNHYGPNYNTLVQRNEELLMAEFDPPEGPQFHSYHYCPNLGTWQ